jgi:hypothetical protein
VILLIKLEGERFNWYKQKAWERDNQLLTERGLELMEEAFADVDISEFWINVKKEETLHKCTVSRMKSTSEFTVTIPMKDTMGSRFGSCTCGKPTKDGVPCKHMVAIVKVSKIEGLNQIQIMPYWLTSAHWQAQYAADVYCRTDVSMNAVKATSNPVDNLRYSPAWTAGNKKGRPKKNIHQKSVIDLIEESSNNKRKGEGRCSAISVRSSITPQQTALRILQINCRLLEMQWRVRFRKDWRTRICAKKECDSSMLNVAGCDIVMVYFQYV